MRELFFPVVSILFLTMSLSSPGFAKSGSNPAPSASVKIPASRAEVTTLPNGLTILIEEDPSAPVASVQVWVQTGSIHEGKWLGAGLSHILEHMLFKGTARRGGGAIAREVQNEGGYINAYTSFDRTVYWIDVPASGVATAVDILADAMLNSTLPEEEYAKEQEVIRREFAMGSDDPDRVSSRLMFGTLFTESPYRHPVIGYLDVYNRLTRQDVLDYYRRRYVPNNMFFVIVGDVDATAVRTQLEALFKDVPRSPLPPEWVAPEPPQVGRRDGHETFPTELSRLTLAWQAPPATHPDMPALDLLTTVLGDGKSTPLYRELREDRALAFSISAGSYSLADGGVVAVQAVTDPGKREALEAGILEILERAKQPGAITQAQLDKARKSLLTSQLGQLATMRGKAADLGSNWLLTRNPNYSADYLDAINEVTLADLERVARQYLRVDRVTVTSLNPPDTKPSESSTTGQTMDPTVHAFELPNGLRLLVRENPKLPLVSLTAVFAGGLLAETKDTNGLSRLVSRTMVKGTKSRSAAEIAEEIESLGGGIGAESGNNSATVDVGVLASDLATGVELLADVIINPTFPDAEFQRERDAQVAAIKAEDDQITSVARDLLRQNLFQDHPYGLKTSGRAETVSGFTPDDARALHQRIFTARNGIIAVFGDVKADVVHDMVRKAFASMPSGTTSSVDIPAAAKVARPLTVEAKRDKNQAVIMIGYPGVALDSPDRAAMEIIEEASSDLGSRFFERIREKMGLAYFVGAAQMIGPTPGMLMFYLGTDPAKADQVRVELKDEIAQLAAEGLTDEEIARSKKKLIGAEAIRNQSNRAMAQAIALDTLFGLGVDHHTARADEIERVTPADIRRVASMYLRPEFAVEAVVSPAAPSAPPGVTP